MAENDDLRTFMSELMDEFDRKMAAREARLDRGLVRRADDEFAEDRKRRALLVEKARRLGRKRS